MADDVVAVWKRQSFKLVLTASRLMQLEIIGVSDGSQRGENCTYSWVMQTCDGEYSSLGKVRSYTRELDSYGSELHGVLSMMPDAWEVNSRAQVKACCVNQNDVEGFKKPRAAIGRDVTGVAPKFNHSVDFWEEAEQWCRKWKQQFMLEWAKGHREKRGPTRISWSMVDLMNHAADRAAEY